MYTCPELLAPAGSPDTLRAVIAAGADAVYLGGYRFGARHFATNFDDKALEEAVAYAHLRRVKVYVTVNTLVHDDELPDVIRYLVFLCSIGVDAILVQDAGLLSLARILYDSILLSPALHASTQMAIHNREGAEYAVTHGCTRIVLARELPFDEVREIGEVMTLRGCETEIFAHGALCYAYSGQCLLSAVIGGRSGNRGMCAQPCRKPYKLLNGDSDEFGRLDNPDQIPLNDEYLLSTRDLWVYPEINRIISLPVAALKIEGRMRSPEYGSTVTSIYRHALDSACNKPFKKTLEDEINLTLAFSRGFTTGYLCGQNPESVMGRDQSGRRGIYIGEVIGSDISGLISVEMEKEIYPEPGDGMVCIGPYGEQGFVLRQEPHYRDRTLVMDADIICRTDDKIFLTSRRRSARAFENLIQHIDDHLFGMISLDLILTISPGGIVTVEGRAEPKKGTPVSFSVIASEHLVPARSRPLSEEQIETTMRKTGGTLFSIRSLEISYPGDLFAPLSVVNGIRREVLQCAAEELIKSHQPSPDVHKQTIERSDSIIADILTAGDCEVPRASRMDIVTLVSDTISVEAAIKNGAKQIFIEWFPAPGAPGTPDFEELKKLGETASAQSCILGIKLPRIIRRHELDLVYSCLPQFINAGIRSFLVDGIGIAEALNDLRGGLSISGYSGLNITNHRSLGVLTGYSFLTLSPELAGHEMWRTMNSAFGAGIETPVAIIVQGMLEAMITEDRPGDLASESEYNKERFGLMDATGQIFPLICDPCGRSHIFNAVETSLISLIDDIRALGVRYLIIDARWRSPTYVRNVVKTWSDAIAVPHDEWNEDYANRFREQIRTYSNGGITSATWKRGLIGMPQD
ncbi:MAG TPA: DUF3656 domain-containing protein [Methanospirillum sp.]|nr:DUF3656 domain-containing protein [Methanospirillum sp.]